SRRITLGVQDMRRNLLSTVGRQGFVWSSLCGSADWGFLGLFLPPVAPAVPAPESRKTLEVYFVDVEGGQATLFVTPEGNWLLIDTVWPGNDARDADRIVAAAKLAGSRRGKLRLPRVRAASRRPNRKPTFSRNADHLRQGQTFRLGRPNLGQGAGTDVSQKQARQNRCLYRLSPWLVSEQQPRAGVRNRSSRGHHGQRRKKGRNTFCLGHHQGRAAPRGSVAIAFFR